MWYLWVSFLFGFPQTPCVIWSPNISTQWTSNDIYKSTESIFHASYANQGVRHVCRTHLVTLIGRDSNYAALKWKIPSSSPSKTEERVYPYVLQKESGKFLVTLECVIRKLLPTTHTYFWNHFFGFFSVNPRINPFLKTFATMAQDDIVVIGQSSNPILLF